MRRALLVLGLLAADPAAAKVALLYHPGIKPTDAFDNAIEDQIASMAMFGLVRGMFDEYAKIQGIPAESLYIVVPTSMVTPYMYRFGKFPKGPGSSDTTTVDVVVHPNFFKPGVTNLYAGTYRPHAMTLTDTLPYVPQVCLINAGVHQAGVLGVATGFADASTCSVGVKNATGAGSDGFIASGESPSGTHEGERSQYQPGWPEVWFNTDYTGFCLRNTTQPPGGVRTLLATAGNSNYFVTEKWGVLTNPDSCQRHATGDSVSVWTRLNAHATGAKEMIFAVAFAPSYGLEVGGEAAFIAEWLRPSIINIMAALAHADSLTSGGVFGKGTLKVGLAVTHWFARSARRNPGGYFPADSTNVYNSLDSLAALDVKITAAVNVDSINSYNVTRSDVLNLLAVPKMRFVPMILTGTLDTTKMSGGIAAQRLTSYGRPIDAFGRYRKRPLSYGPWPPTTVSGDSSTSTLIRGALDLVGSNFGGRATSVIWPAGEDWSPTNYEKSDSILIAAKLAGAVGVVFDPRDRNVSGGSFPGANPRGWYNEARTFPGGAKLIPRIGYNTTAAQWFPVVAEADSAWPLSAAPAQNFALLISQRAWWALLGPKYDRDWAGVRETTDHGTADGLGYWGGARGRILAVSAQELSGPTTKEYAVQPGGPYRMGWYGIKHFVHAARVLNRLAGRSLISFEYLDEL